MLLLLLLPCLAAIALGELDALVDVDALNVDTERCFVRALLVVATIVEEKRFFFSPSHLSRAKSAPHRQKYFRKYCACFIENKSRSSMDVAVLLVDYVYGWAMQVV